MYRPLVYESWDDSDKILPERTYLYHLQPLGIGSIFVESLTGYIARLAEAHDISPAMLLNRELLPRMRATSNSGLRKAAVPMDSTFLYNSHVLNGAGEHPPNCVQVLENLTGTENLRAMTLLRLGEVLSTQHLLRAQQAWCPAVLRNGVARAARFTNRCFGPSRAFPAARRIDAHCQCAARTVGRPCILYRRARDLGIAAVVSNGSASSARWIGHPVRRKPACWWLTASAICWRRVLKPRSPVISLRRT